MKYGTGHFCLLMGLPPSVRTIAPPQVLPLLSLALEELERVAAPRAAIGESEAERLLFHRRGESACQNKTKQNKTKQNKTLVPEPIRSADSTLSHVST
jgi:hypothetical protein